MDSVAWASAVETLSLYRPAKCQEHQHDWQADEDCAPIRDSWGGPDAHSQPDAYRRCIAMHTMTTVASNDNLRREKPNSGDDSLHYPTRISGACLTNGDYDER